MNEALTKFDIIRPTLPNSDWNEVNACKKLLPIAQKKQKTADYVNILLIIVGFWNKCNHNGYMEI